MDPVGFAAGSALASIALWSLRLSSVFPHGQQMWVEWMAWAVIAAGCKLRMLRMLRKRSRPAAPSDDEEKSMLPSTKAASWRAMNSNNTNSSTNINSSFVALLLVMSQFVTLYGIGYAVLTSTAYSSLAAVSRGDSCDDMDQFFFSRLLDALDAISLRAFAMWTLFLALTSTPIPTIGVFTAIFVMLRLAQLFAIITLCSGNFPFVAAAMVTTASVLCDDRLVTTHSAAAADTLIAAVALVQAYQSLPKIRGSRALVFALLLTPLIRIILLPTTDVRSGNPVPAPLPSFGPVHPIEQLVKTQQHYFKGKLASQSRTISEAVAEYKHRYGRPPPPNFDKWFEVAKSKDFLFIDELDTIMESLEPFWGVSPESLRARIKSVQDAEQIASVTVARDSFAQSGEHYHVDHLKNFWLNRTTWGEAIPEVNFVISVLDEPRVVVPDDTLDLAMQKASENKLHGSSQPWGATESALLRSGKSSERFNNVEWISVGQQHAWETMVSSCHINDPARRETGVEEKKNLYPFVSNVTTEQDVCASSDLLNNHGFLASPQSLVVTHSLVPIFSQCKPSVFNDVLYPSPHYQFEIMSEDYNEDEDPAWESKQDRLYWAGASTGGFSTSENWMKLHRQRLTLMTAPQSTAPVNLLERDTRRNWQPRTSNWTTISDLFYTRLTSVIQCSEKGCAAQEEVFNADPEEKSAALANKYLLDIDGNSFSGRYYRLLKSKSAVLKYTVFKEWHDDRLIPWVHYIPVSNSGEELGEIIRFLVEEPEGKVIGETIANESREWTQKTLRAEDLEIVFIRVLMEYARIMHDDRDTMNFELDG
ncbi:hypothetical protein DV738_g4070, partial [Chaetothyriales sp. CBS 135597]